MEAVLEAGVGSICPFTEVFLLSPRAVCCSVGCSSQKLSTAPTDKPRSTLGETSGRRNRFDAPVRQTGCAAHEARHAARLRRKKKSFNESPRAGEAIQEGVLLSHPPMVFAHARVLSTLSL